MQGVLGGIKVLGCGEGGGLEEIYWTEANWGRIQFQKWPLNIKV